MTFPQVKHRTGMIMVELFGLGVLFSVDGRTDRTRRTPKMALNSSPDAVTVDMFLLTMEW